MNLIEYNYSYHSWGYNKEELHRIDLVTKEYTHFDHGKLDASMPLPDDFIDTISSFFEGLFTEGFPNNMMAWDAPMWSLTIDEKKCIRIALADEDSLFEIISSLFTEIKAIAMRKDV